MKKLAVAFFTEAGKSEGMGHLIRSSCIAKQFEKLGCNLSFFLQGDNALQHKQNNISPFKWNELLIADDYDIIFIDSYQAQLKHYQLLTKHCQLAVFIDDFNRLDYPDGVILNFSPDAEKKFSHCKKASQDYLLGLNYLPIRENFLKEHKQSEDHIFIMLGGTDAADLSITILKALQSIHLKKVIVCNNKNSLALINTIENTQVLFRPDDNELTQAMASAKIAISTASMTAYELAVLKVPTIILAVSKDQKLGAQQLINNHIAADMVSTQYQKLIAELPNKVARLINHKQEKFNDKIDGYGASNIAKAILERLDAKSKK